MALLTTCALQSHSFHLVAQRWLVSNEPSVSVCTFGKAPQDSLEAPNVELTCERPVLGLVEMARHNLLVEGFLIVYLERSVVRKPRNDGRVAFPVGCLEHFM